MSPGISSLCASGVRGATWSTEVLRGVAAGVGNLLQLLMCIARMSAGLILLNNTYFLLDQSPLSASYRLRIYSLQLRQ